MQLDSVTELLGIANFRVAYMVYHGEKRIELILERIVNAPYVCSGCGRVHNTAVHSVDMITVEDLPISGKRVFLHVPKRRAVCPERSLGTGSGQKNLTG
jgi:transposase